MQLFSPGSNEICLLEPPKCSLKLPPAHRCCRSMSSIHPSIRRVVIVSQKQPENNSHPRQCVDFDDNALQCTAELASNQERFRRFQSKLRTNGTTTNFAVREALRERREMRRRWPNVVLQTRRVLSANCCNGSLMWSVHKLHGGNVDVA